MPSWPGFVGGSYQAQSVLAAGERTVNLYVEEMQTAGATVKRALFPTPGFRAWSSVTDLGGRGFIVAEGRLFGVMGGQLYEFDSNGTPTARGAVAQDSNPAQLIFNGLVGGQVGIASGKNFYTFTLATNTFAAVPALAAKATMIAYAAGYGLAFDSSSGKVYLSNLNDLTTWDTGGTFFQRSLFADPWQAMFVDGNNLIWLPGTDTYEVWYNTGTGTQPWAPLSGLVGRYGIASPFAFGLRGSAPFWLSRNPEGAGLFIALGGSGAQAVSTYAVDTAINTYERTSSISNAEVMTYQQAGHTFVNIAFPSPMKTWTYDIETQSWHERGKWNSVRGDYDLWAPRAHVYAYGKHLVGDRTTGTIWEMDPSFATDVDGAGIRRLRRSPGVIREKARLRYDRLELFMDVGVGTATGQGVNPKVMLRVSVDGGMTWGNELQASFGRMGQYGTRVYWNRLGILVDAVFEVTVSDPVPVRFLDAWFNNLERAA